MAASNQVAGLCFSIKASAAFISQVQNDDPDGFAQASNDIAADPDLTQPLPADATPADLTAAVLSTDPGFSFNNSGRVTGYSFNADGSGHLSNSSLDGDMSWSLNGSRIHIAYAAPAGFVTFPFIICNGVPLTPPPRTTCPTSAAARWR